MYALALEVAVPTPLRLVVMHAWQGVMFSVLWRLGQDYMAKQEKEKEAKAAAEATAKSAPAKKK